MGWFSSAKEDYDALIRELTLLVGQIKFHQQKALQFANIGDLKGIANAGHETKEAAQLIAEAKKIAKKLEKICKKQKWPIPQVVSTLLSEELFEGKERKALVKRGVKA